MKLGLSSLPLEVTPLSRDLSTRLYGKGRRESREGLHVSCSESFSAQSGTPGLLTLCSVLLDSESGRLPRWGCIWGGLSSSPDQVVIGKPTCPASLLPWEALSQALTADLLSCFPSGGLEGRGSAPPIAVVRPPRAPRPGSARPHSAASLSGRWSC